MKKNFMYNLCYQIIQIIIPLILLPYVTRVLGADTLGEYNYAFTIATYFLSFAMLGVTNYGSRSIAAHQEDKEKRSEVFWSIYTLQFCVAAVISVVYFVLTVFVLKSNIAMIQLLIVLSAAFDINWFFFGVEQFRITVTRNIAIKIVTTALVFLLVKRPEDVITYTLIYAVGTFASQTAVWFYLKQYVLLKQINIKASFEHLKPMLVLFVPIIAISLYKYMDKIMLGSLCEYSYVAYYSNSESIVAIPAVITTALGTVALPRMTALSVEGKKEKSKQYVEISLQFAMFLACLMGFGTFSVADVFVPIFFGKDFSYCSLLMKMMFPCVILQAWASIIRMQFLLPNAYDKVYVVSVVSGAVVNFCVNLLLIPRLDARGAVIGTIVAEAVVAIIQTAYSAKYLPVRVYLKSSIVYLVAGVLMTIIIVTINGFMHGGMMCLIFDMLLGVIVYISFTYIVLRYSGAAIYLTIHDTFNDLLSKIKGE